MTDTAESSSTAIVVTDENGTVLTSDLDIVEPPDDLKELEGLGFIVPLSSPSRLRQAFAIKQRIYAAILDPNDYLYIVPYNEGGKTRQWVSANREDAIKFASLQNATTINAKPKKSGIVKLARALGIEAKCVLRQGLPDEPTANYSYCVYEAVHKRTGFKEEGVGWCDRTEKNGRITTHDVIATADTRAYNRAVLRLSGFGDISADEIIAGVSGNEPLVENVPEPQEFKAMEALPAPTEDNVITASRAWAEAVSKRDGEMFLPDAQQHNKAYRELRARARRGDTGAAAKLGALGARWKGMAQDGNGYTPFEVEAPPVKPEDFAAVQAAAAPAADNGKSVDLTGAPTPEPSSAPAPATSDTAPPTTIPQPNMQAETITTAQARSVSQLLFKLFNNSKPDAREWIKTHAHVDKSVSIRTNQFGPIMAALTKLTEKEATSG